MIAYLDVTTIPVSWHWFFALSVAAVIGSFLTVATTRLPRRLRGGVGPTSLGGRSYCPFCGAMIPLYRNIPVLTFVLQRGRTACCEQKIPPMYLGLELGTVAIAAVSIGAFGFTLAAAVVFLVMVLLMGLLVACKRRHQLDISSF